MGHQITLSEAIAAEMLEDSAPQRLLRPVDIAIEIVGQDETVEIASAWHCRAGTWISGNLLDQVLLRWTEVRWQNRDAEVRVTLRSDPYIYRDISFATILAVARYHAGEDVRIGFIQDLCNHPNDKDLIDDDDLIAMVVANSVSHLTEARP